MSLEIGVGIYLGLEKPLLSGLGPELVVNGGFDVDAIWSKGVGWTIAGGFAVAASGTDSSIQQAISIVNGITYHFTLTVLSFSAGSLSPNLGGTATAPIFGVGTFTEDLVAGVTGLVVVNKNLSYAGSIDNVSVREVL